MDADEATRTAEADKAARLARRADAERAQLTERPVNDPLLTTTAITLIAAVVAAIIVAALYWVL